MAFEGNQNANGRGPMDRSWRKSRIAARILLRSKISAVAPRYGRLAKKLAADPGVTNRLIEQALSSIQATKRNYECH
jgi:hypothetical protein